MEKKFDFWAWFEKVLRRYGVMRTMAVIFASQILLAFLLVEITMAFGLK